MPQDPESQKQDDPRQASKAEQLSPSAIAERFGEDKIYPKRRRESDTE
jgi:hypothetical protein